MNIFTKVNNIWRTNYQAIAWRPMPLRNFEMGIRLAFTK